MVRAESISGSLIGNVRAYVQGDLKSPQDFEHVHSKDVEIGFANYDQDGVDDPHFHPIATEAQVVISGFVELLNIDTGKQIDLAPGDFYVVEPGVKHVQRATSGTRVLIVKWPSLNDKTLIEPDAATQLWIAESAKREATPDEGF